MGQKKNIDKEINRETKNEEFNQLHNSQFINGLVKDINKNASDTFIDMDLADLLSVK